MRKYYGEVANLENWEKHHRVITVEADSVQKAYTLICEQKNIDEDIYQISRDFFDCSLPQPVYDFFNLFTLAGSESSAETWQEHLKKA
jgi:hypothetical protein